MILYRYTKKLLNNMFLSSSKMVLSLTFLANWFIEPDALDMVDINNATVDANTDELRTILI